MEEELVVRARPAVQHTERERRTFERRLLRQKQTVVRETHNLKFAALKAGKIICKEGRAYMHVWE